MIRCVVIQRNLGLDCARKSKKGIKEKSKIKGKQGSKLTSQGVNLLSWGACYTVDGYCVTVA